MFILLLYNSFTHMSPKELIENLREELREHNHRYYVMDDPSISDFEFDQKLKQLQQLESAYPQFFDSSSPTLRVGGDITKNFNTVVHANRMYSLDNSYSKADLLDWEKRIYKHVDGPIDYICELKYDGASISITYENGFFSRAVTRGDGTQGDDVSANVKTIKSVPLKLKGDFPNKFEIRGEIIMPFDGFALLNKKRTKAGLPTFKNPRNTASGSLKLQDSSEVSKRPLECLLYSIHGLGTGTKTQLESLEKASSLGFKVPKSAKRVDSMEGVFEFITFWNQHRHNLPYETDGVVVKVNNLIVQEELGFTSKAPRWAIAYKFKSTQVFTFLNDISYQVGRTGAITPVAELDAVELAGTIVKRASLHNADQIARLDIRINDQVYVEKGGEIIPKIVGVNLDKRPQDSVPVSYIDKCPECHTKLIRISGEAQHYCPNHLGCPPQIIGRIQHYISRKALDIEGLGGETVALLVREGLISNYADLYTLNVGQLLPLDRMALKSAEKLVQGVLNSTKVPFERVLFGLGIRYVGETVAKKLAHHFKSIDRLIGANFEDLISVDEIGDKIAESVLAFFEDPLHLLLINQLKVHGVKLELSESDTKGHSNILNGSSFVVSGVFEKVSRNELKRLIETNGGRLASSISSKTTYLVAGQNMGPSKKIKAEKLSIPILSEEDFLSKINF